MSGLKIEYMGIDDLIPYINNPRINDGAVDKVASSIKNFGFKNPIIIDKGNEIIAGHTRWKAARKLGLEEVPTIKVEDLTDSQVKAFRIADNKTGEFAEWDMELLEVELEGLDDEFTGFDLGELEEMFQDYKGVIEDNFEVELPEEPITKAGDIWLLGKHRLICGDATLIDDVEKLMDGKQADMVFTDPPYNVDYEGGTKEKLKIQNDKMSNDNFYQFLYDAFVNMYTVTISGGAIYICHADSEGINFRTAMVNSGWLQKQCIIWAKNSIVMGRQDYQWKHEPILYGWKPGEAHKWYGKRNKSTVIEDYASVTLQPNGNDSLITFTDGLNSVTIKVPKYEVVDAGDDSEETIWRIEKPLRNGEHPTMKPIAIPARAIKNSSKAGGIVLDLFGGSGSTLIAAEQLNRICYISELDPIYCDVIVQRWENLTGRKAVLLK